MRSEWLLRVVKKQVTGEPRSAPEISQELAGQRRGRDICGFSELNDREGYFP